MSCRNVLAVVLSLSAAAADAGSASWGPVTVLDPRRPLEYGRPLPGAGDPHVVPLAVLFETAPEFQLARVDVGSDPPAVSLVTIDEVGTVFAVGPVGETASGTIGSSYVDNFDLMFWSCALPCDSVSVFTVDSGAESWFDSSSGVVADTFYLAAVDGIAGTIHVRSSTNGGASWTNVRTFTPAGGLYLNFDGGMRVSLVVSAAPIDGGGDRNCLFYERFSGGGTEKRLNCADGATPVFDVLVDTDIQSLHDGLFWAIEAFLGGGPFPFPLTMPDGTLGEQATPYLGLYARRTDQSVHFVRVDTNGSVLVNDFLSFVPVQNEFFSYGLAETDANRVDVVYPASNDLEGFHQILTLDPYAQDPELGPVMDQDPVALAFDPIGGILWGFFSNGAGDFAVSGHPIAIFGDGFETGDTSRWDTVVN